jgi:hypothetical protein
VRENVVFDWPSNDWSNNSSTAGGDPIHRIILALTIAAALAACTNESEQVAQIALRDAERQSKQNEQLLSLHGKVAEGARDLVAADSASRATLAQVHHDMQSERVQLGQQRDLLESDRRTIATQRRTDPVLQEGFEILSMLAAAAAPLGLCWLLLRQTGSAADSSATAEILLNERLHGSN